jgi:DNA-binding NtrC family response regulator
MADILIIDDQDRYIELCRRALPEHRYRGPARSWSEAVELLARARGRVDVVLLDVHFDIEPSELLGWSKDLGQAAVDRLKRRQGLHILRELHARHPELPVVLMTSRQELPLETDADAHAAEEFTYFLDDDYVDARALQAQIQGIVQARSTRDSDGPVYWGRSIAMGRLRQRLTVLARGGLPVVLLGATGTGKSLLARHFVHAKSSRTGRFVSLDLSTLPRELMAAHLFGAMRGAYTGSVADRVGAFEAADGGTLFLDEVGNLSLDAQKMLLSVLQEGVVTRLGDLKERSVDVKLVVATNEDLAGLVRSGKFRSDLYMRLNPAVAVRLPTLVERQHDMERLLSHCLASAMRRPYLRELVRDYCERTGTGRTGVRVHAGTGIPAVDKDRLTLLFPERSVRMLRSHSWPGNLREFAMTAENAVLFALSELQGVEGGDRADVVQVRPKILRDLLKHAITDEHTSGDDGAKVLVSLRSADTLNKVGQDVERQYFTWLYLQHRGDFASMATVLLDDPDAARKVQLRFNQLGLKVRELKEQLR